MSDTPAAAGTDPSPAAPPPPPPASAGQASPPDLAAVRAALTDPAAPAPAAAPASPPTDPPPAGGEAAGDPAPPVRPEGLPDQFWDPEKGEVRMDALIKSHTDFRRRLGDAEFLAEDHQFTPPEGAAYDDGVLDTFRDVAREHGLTRKQAEGLLAWDAGRQAATDQAEREALTRESDILVQAHGARAGEMLDGMVNFAKTLPAGPARAALAEMAKTAAGVELFHALRGGTAERPPPGGGASPALGRDELKSMMQDPKYWRDKDPAFVAKVEAGWRALA